MAIPNQIIVPIEAGEAQALRILIEADRVQFIRRRVKIEVIVKGEVFQVERFNVFGKAHGGQTRRQRGIRARAFMHGRQPGGLIAEAEVGCLGIFVRVNRLHLASLFLDQIADPGEFLAR